MAEREAETERRSALIPVAVIVSLLWLGAWVFLLLTSAGCPAAIGDLWATHVACLTPNEIGDTLAGAFAPLAFLWLMVAVFLQSAELRAQRAELALTRREFELTRGEIAAQRRALEAQAEQAKRNVEFIEQQTGILKRQHDDAESKHVDDNVENMLAIVHSILETRLSDRLTLYITNDQQKAIFKVAFSGNYYSDLATATDQLEDFLERYLPAATSMRQGSELDQCLMLCEKVLGMRDRMSANRRILLDTVSLPRLIAALQAVRDWNGARK